MLQVNTCLKGEELNLKLRGSKDQNASALEELLEISEFLKQVKW